MTQDGVIDNSGSLIVSDTLSVAGGSICDNTPQVGISGSSAAANLAFAATVGSGPSCGTGVATDNIHIANITGALSGSIPCRVHGQHRRWRIRQSQHHHSVRDDDLWDARRRSRRQPHLHGGHQQRRRAWMPSRVVSPERPSASPTSQTKVRSTSTRPPPTACRRTHPRLRTAQRVRSTSRRPTALRSPALPASRAP